MWPIFLQTADIWRTVLITYRKEDRTTMTEPSNRRSRKLRPMRVRDREALRAYVRLLSMSERALADRAGLGHATLNHLLSGRRESCSPETAQAIESVLCCRPGVFFEPC
jgi:DNA-binding Xre family transcriptional regulator